MNWRKNWNMAVLAVLLLGLMPLAAMAQPTAQPDWSKVAPEVQVKLNAAEKTGFYAILTTQADVSGAAALRTKVEKTAYVFEHLKAVADQTQMPVTDYLRSQGVAFKTHYVQNMIEVKEAGRSVVAGLIARPDVAQIMPLPNAQPDPVYQEMTPEQRVQAIEWNITRVKAPQVWALGYHGEGMVVGDNDTGVQYNHPALVGKYRGNLGGGNFNHNYNWWNGLGSNVPSDSDGHGTHTMGTMVGDDGAGNQIGVAPGAQWIACGGLFNVDPVECFEWFLAPWDLNGQYPDPAKAPDAVNNSWYDNSGFDYRPIIQSLTAAGIAVIKSAGNWGSACNTISPPGNVPETIATAAFSNGDVIASFSSRGPSSTYGPTILKPEVAAPGVSVRSSYPTNTYTYMSGTSMAAPHSTASVALIWNAAPCLRGDVPTTKQIMMESADSKIDAQCQPFVGHPNDVWGWGILNELAAVQAAQVYCGGCNPPTNAAFTYAPPSPYTGDTVTFSGSASGTEPITYGWTFGDGGTATGQSVTHAYTTAGTYTVTMTASNSCGQQSVQQSITVQPLIVLHLNKAKMNWAAAARPGLYKVVYSGRVHDPSDTVVAGVLVTGVYTYPDGSQHSVTYTTTAQGQFKFPIKQSQTGVYQLCVTNMQKTGYTFDPNYGEWPSCMSVTVTP